MDRYVWSCSRCGSIWPNDIEECPDCEAYRKPKQPAEFDDED